MCTIDDKKVTGSSYNGLYCYTIDGATIGFSSYWYNAWQPIHPKGVRSLCGTYTAVSKEKLGVWSNLDDTQQKSSYICNATFLSSEESYREYNQHEFNFLVCQD